MAILFTDGFDNYGTTTGTNLLTKWFFSTAPNSISSNTPYGYGQSLLTGAGNFGSSQAVFTPTSTFTIGAAVYINTGGTYGGYPLFGFLSSGTWMVGLVVMNDGSVLVSRMTSDNAATTIGQSAVNVVKLATWTYLEFSCTISDTVGTVRVDVNGQTVLNLSNLDTRNGTPTTVSTLYAGGNGVVSSSGTIIDDLYISDSITPLGPQRIETLRPNADTAQKQWTASTGSDNFAMVDESPMNTTDYVYTSTLNNYDLYDFVNLSATPASISSVTAYALVQKDNVSTRAIAVPVKSGSTTSDGANVYLSSTWTLSSRILETDPNTSSAWTGSAVNAIQAGLKVTI